jgi:hypothetical protein
MYVLYIPVPYVRWVEGSRIGNSDHQSDGSNLKRRDHVYETGGGRKAVQEMPEWQEDKNGKLRVMIKVEDREVDYDV